MLYTQPMLFTLLALSVFTSHADVTIADLERLYERARQATSQEAKESVARERASLTRSVQNRPDLFAEKVFRYDTKGAAILFDPLLGFQGVFVNIVNMLKSGAYLVRDLGGNIHLCPSFSIREITPTAHPLWVTQHERIGQTDGSFEVGAQKYWVLANRSFSWIAKEDQLVFGREPIADERVVVKLVEGAATRLHAVNAIFPNGEMVVGDRFLVRPTKHPAVRNTFISEGPRPAWTKKDGEWFEITTIGRIGNRHVYFDGGAPHAVLRPVRALASDPLIGRPVVLTDGPRPIAFAVVKQVLTNGAIVTDLGRIVLPHQFSLDLDGQLAQRLEKMRRKRAALHVLSSIPRWSGAFFQASAGEPAHQDFRCPGAPQAKRKPGGRDGFRAIDHH